MDNFDSKLGMDTNNDEAWIEEVVVDDEILDLFYRSEAFDEHKIDFGGGIFGITCRAVINVCGNNPDKLRKLLNLPKNKYKIDTIKQILDGCHSSVANAAYLV